MPDLSQPVERCAECGDLYDPKTQGGECPACLVELCGSCAAGDHTPGGAARNETIGRHVDEDEAKHGPLCAESRCRAPVGPDRHCDEHRPVGFTDPDGGGYRWDGLAWVAPDVAPALMPRDLAGTNGRRTEPADGVAVTLFGAVPGYPRGHVELWAVDESLDASGLRAVAAELLRLADVLDAAPVASGGRR